MWPSTNGAGSSHRATAQLTHLRCESRGRRVTLTKRERDEAREILGETERKSAARQIFPPVDRARSRAQAQAPTERGLDFARV